MYLLILIIQMKKDWMNRLKKYPILVYANSCIIASIIEELIFIGLIFVLIKKFSVIVAYLVSTFLFAFAHFQFNFSILISKIYYFLVYFILGVLLALYLWLWWLHLSFNVITHASQFCSYCILIFLFKYYYNKNFIIKRKYIYIYIMNIWIYGEYIDEYISTKYI